MKLKLDPASQSVQRPLFDAGPALVDFIDMKNSMVRLADSIQWDVFEEHWQSMFSAAGGPMASAGRRVAGLLMLKHGIYAALGQLTDQKVARVISVANQDVFTFEHV